MSEQSKSVQPTFQSYGNEKWTTTDGTQYRGLMGHFTIVDAKGPPVEGNTAPQVWETAEEATGHLREALDAGMTLVYFNLRPGVHHVKSN